MMDLKVILDKIDDGSQAILKYRHDELREDRSIRKRTEWIDAAKFLGIFFIYVGHFCDVAGLAYGWVFSFHVPLFFFLSGCLENYNKRGILENAWHKFVTIVVPFFFFGILVTAVDAANGNTLANMPNQMVILLKGGIRNSPLLAVGLWFLTCLFAMEVMFSIIKKLRFKPVIAAVCLALYFAAELLINPRPAVTPHWYWNFDSASYYIIFYCIGWLIYEPLNKLLSSEKKEVKYIVFAAFSICFAFSARLFFGINMLTGVYESNPVFAELGGIITPMISIFMVIVISNYLSNNEFIKKIGRNTLYLCGNEYLIKILVPMVLSTFGLTVALTSPVQIYIYTFILLVVVNMVLVPLEKPFLDKIQKFLKFKKKPENEALQSEKGK